MESTEVFHKAAQYLATAAKSFIPAKDDDSHTNLFWDRKQKVLRTGSLNDEGLVLELNHQVYALDVVHPRSGLSGSFPLTGARHLDIINWLDREREFCGIKEPYAFELPYKLPYEKELEDDFKFPSLSGDEMDSEIERRDKSDEILRGALDALDRIEKVRVWPHHFDAAFSVQPEGRTTSFIGVGVAIPDEVCNEHYIYVSAFQGNTQINTDKMPSLEIGEWKNDDWKGAMLPLGQASQEQGIDFVKAAFKAYWNYS